MATLSLQSLRVSDTRDVSALLERCGAEELRALERRVRADMEHKKEELRQTVGERYRDLMDAADTIGDMRECSARVLTSVRDMQRYCGGLRLGTAEPGDRERVQRQSQEQFYCIAAQIKLLLEIPERIWSSMEASQHLQAARLYLLCCHLQALLRLDASGTRCSPVLARFPILVRQVAAAGTFRSTILMESRSLLRDRGVCDQAVADALVSTMLLEDSSPRQALADFLLARTAAVQQLLLQPQHGAGVKAQVCSLVELMANTLFQAYALFYLAQDGAATEPGLSCGLLFSTLENVTSAAPAGEAQWALHREVATGSWFKHLPPSVTQFQPALRMLAQPIQPEQLRNTLQQWIKTCKEDVCRGVGALLLYVKSVKGLASVRDGVWELLSSDSIVQHWSCVCQRLLEQHLCLWDDFLQQLFLQRLQTLTQEDMRSITDGCKQMLTSSLRDLETPGGASRMEHYEVDVASFVWAESPGDVPNDAAWLGSAPRRPEPTEPALPSGLSLKTRAVTPCVQSFSSVFDSRLRVKLDDLRYYLPSEGDMPTPGPVPTGRFRDAGAVEETLRHHCLSCVHELLDLVRCELSTAKDRPQGHAQITPTPGHAPVLFLARLCQSLPELCPSLKQCVEGKQAGAISAGAKETPRQSRAAAKGGTKVGELGVGEASWSSLKEELHSCSMQAYGIWGSSLCQELVQGFAAKLHITSPGAALETVTCWEELEIQEETESGSSVTSKIRLPVQPSWYVQSLLFHLCLEVNRVGGHALPRRALQELLHSCLDKVVGEYEKLAASIPDKDSSVTQNRSLQLLFDLRYLSSSLAVRPEEARSSRSTQGPRIQQVCDWLESHIDPFDLDVFTPHLNSNLNRACQRTGMLLVLLSGPQKPFTTRASGSSSSQDAPNSLPLASSQIRFGLLPLSMNSTRKAVPRGANASRSPAPPSIPAGEEPFRAGSLFHQLTNQEEEPPATSLFKLGWLSSMGK